MQYRIKTLLIVMVLASCASAAFIFVNRPVTLRIGMSREAVLRAIDDIRGHDIATTIVSNTYTVRLPLSDPELQKIADFEYSREQSVIFSKDKELNKFWKLPHHGIVETHFEEGKLISILKWAGDKNLPLEELRLDPGPTYTDVTAY